MPSLTWLKQTSKNFYQEIDLANKNETTSLPFIIHQLSPTPIVKDREKFQVLKIGGSILQNALVYQSGPKLVIESMEEERLPIFSTGKSFLAFIKAHLRKQVKVLALNFAYPLKPVFENNRLDGVLISGSKEHAFSGLVGKQVGDTIEEYIKSKFNKQIVVSLANDTICLALSGLQKDSTYGLAGGIVGTGMNFAFFLNKRKLVNLEAANFDKFSQSLTGIEIDKKSLQPGAGKFEKEVSGAYLYQHYNLQTKKTKIHSTHEMDKVARGEKNGNKQLAKQLLKGSAELVSCQIAGIANYCQKQMRFIMEGSLFWQGYNYQKTVKQTVSKLTKHKVEFEEIPDCGIIGAAKLVI